MEAQAIMSKLDVADPLTLPSKTYLAKLRDKAALIVNSQETADELVQRALYYIIHGEIPEILYEDLLAKPVTEIFDKVAESLDQMIRIAEKISLAGQGRALS